MGGSPSISLIGEKRMQRTCALLLALSVALVASQIPENAIVAENEPLVEALIQAPHTETTDPDGTISTPDDGVVASGGPNNNHDEQSCDEGEVLCPNGSCAIQCEDLSFKKPDEAYDYTFRPNPTKLDPAPAVAGRQADYVAEANNYLGSQTDAEQRAVTKAEQSAGLTYASHDAALDEETMRNSAKKLEVEKLMNVAAGHAADFKSKSAAHDTSVLNVQKAKGEEQKQAAIVQQAEATLKQEKENWKKTKEHVTAMENEEQNRRYQAEFAGQQYEHAKAEAIKADNDLQESIHETEEKDKFRQVARKAVEKAAKEELKAVHEKAVKPTPIKTNTSELVCEDCSGDQLPKVYTEAGGKCSDCPAWAEKGNCEAKEYSEFMHHYCRKSCGCKATAPAQAIQTALKMPKA